MESTLITDTEPTRKVSVGFITSSAVQIHTHTLLHPVHRRQHRLLRVCVSVAGCVRVCLSLCVCVYVRMCMSMHVCVL